MPTVTAIFLAPLMAMLPVAGAVGSAEPPMPEAAAAPSGEDHVSFQAISATFRIESANQVRIEQRTVIRVAPQSRPAVRNMFMDLPQRAIGPHFIERKIGKCLPIGGIAGVQADGRNRLLLFMRDRRIVSAGLERACNSRDFYSGFYVAPNADNLLCVDRDALQSRSGANCKLSRIRQLVEIDY